MSRLLISLMFFVMRISHICSRVFGNLLLLLCSKERVVVSFAMHILFVSQSMIGNSFWAEARRLSSSEKMPSIVYRICSMHPCTFPFLIFFWGLASCFETRSQKDNCSSWRLVSLVNNGLGFWNDSCSPENLWHFFQKKDDTGFGHPKTPAVALVENIDNIIKNEY